MRSVCQDGQILRLETKAFSHGRGRKDGRERRGGREERREREQVS